MTSAPRYLPTSRGFDTSSGFLGSGEDHFNQRSDGAGKLLPPAQQQHTPTEREGEREREREMHAAHYRRRPPPLTTPPSSRTGTVFGWFSNPGQVSARAALTTPPHTPSLVLLLLACACATVHVSACAVDFWKDSAPDHRNGTRVHKSGNPLAPWVIFLISPASPHATRMRAGKRTKPT